MYSFKKVTNNVIPKGTYKAQVTDVKFANADLSNGHFDMKVTYTISEGEYKNRTITDFMSEKAFSFRLKPFLTALGVDMDREFNTARELYEWGSNEAKGKFAMIEVGTRDYQGNEYNSINGWSALPGSTSSVEDVLNEFGESPEIVPEKPTVADIANEPPTLGDVDGSVDTNGVSDDDLPF